jgi:hypothetical protein
VGAYETTSVANPAMLPSIMLLSQSLAMTEETMSMMVASAVREMASSSKLQVLCGLGGTFGGGGGGWR